MSAEWVRCGNCGKKLGEILASGDVEVRRNGRVVRIKVGSLDCSRCNMTVQVRPGSAPTTSVSTRGVFRTGGHVSIPGRR